MNRINVQRGLVVRRALLAVAQAAHDQNRPMPTLRRLSVLMRISEPQIWKHFRRLKLDGQVVIAAQRTRNCRIYIEKVTAP